MATRVSLSYYPWITQNLGGADLDKAIRGCAALLNPVLSQTFGEPIAIMVLPPMQVPDQIRAIIAGSSDPNDVKIALMNPIGFALAHQQVEAVKSAAVVRRHIGTGPAGPTYRAQIYANVLTGAKTLDELRGKTFAFGSAQSTSNFLVPARMLWKAGLHPMNCFTQLVFSGGHKKAATDVYDGRADAGAGHDGVIMDLQADHGFSNAPERLVRLQWSDPIPSDPVAVRTSDDKAFAAVQNALTQFAPKDGPDAPGNVAISKFWNTADGLELIDSAAYSPLLGYMSDLSIRPSDIL